MPNPLEVNANIVDFVRRNGPVLPVQISKEIGSNLLFAGAIMSELVRNKKLKLSYVKVGGSPVYYVEGQENKLQDYYKYLNEKEREIYEILKEKKVLEDTKLEPWQRVAIREIKDFANMLKTNTGEIFWKWYLTDLKDAEIIIKSWIKKEKKVEEKIVKEPKVIEKQEKLREGASLEFINEYFIKKNIKILEENLIRKNKEVDYTVNIPSEVGNIKFFVKFKDKKKISDSDLILAHNKSRSKKLPLLFLSKGDLTKKAMEYIEKDYLLFEKV
ncbi:MAG: hypothetical protein ISS82_00460 [Nanoarchaeota archaeon]|nr:hypothetical protein [Nanoarchaeota archaeon]